MNAHPPPPSRFPPAGRPAPAGPRGLAGRPILTVTIALAALIGAGLGGVALAKRGDDSARPLWKQPEAAPARSKTAAEQPTPTLAANGTVTLSATGDIIMGSAPDKLPANGGRGFFADVQQSLRADLVMGNLEQPLTNATVSTKCRREVPATTPGGQPTVTVAKNCFAFRAPPSYAAHLKEAGFQLLNTANNHSRDYGAAGYRSTQQALERQSLRHTGSTDEITVVDVEGVKVAVAGFSSYAGANSLIDLAQARRVVKQAARRADIVVVQVHMGAEGAGRGHVKPGTERFFGENRGDPMTFSRAVIDSGADLVVGHGPHVLRGMEFYRGRLIAYSLGNFAGGGNTLSNSGVLRFGGILKASLTADGSWGGGEFISTELNASGRPIRDTKENGRTLVARLAKADFGASAAVIGRDGAISPPG
jgi:poly-gamma-glutamate capsule biosynthesis protein CapA/YwtB (metallophosphatase superfamily)